MLEITPETAEKLVARLATLARRHAELERSLADPQLAQDTASYAKVAREHGELSLLAEKHGQIESARNRRAEAEGLLAEGDHDQDLLELAREEIEEAQAAEQRLLGEALELMLSDPQQAGRNVIVEIRSGTGGEEAALFAADLFGMYTRYAQRKGWKVEMLDSSATDRGGFREIIFSVAGRGAWQGLRFESGGHRVQRVPVTESQGRIHTSLATVAVLPEAQEVDVDIRPDELEVTFMRSQGPGGQNVNKVNSCVRIVHRPTGIAVKCQEQKSQHKNRMLAMKILRARLLENVQQESKQERDALRRSQVGSGERNERVRTYNFPQDRVTDHRTGASAFGIQSILMGECDQIFDALGEWDRQQRISALTGG